MAIIVNHIERSLGSTAKIFVVIPYISVELLIVIGPNPSGLVSILAVVIPLFTASTTF